MGRGERRDRTFLVSKRRWVECGACLAPRSPHVFAKRTPFGCRCSKRKLGQPRLNSGLCGFGNRKRVYAGRRRSVLLRGLARQGWSDWDSDRVALLEREEVPW